MQPTEDKGRGVSLRATFIPGSAALGAGLPACLRYPCFRITFASRS